MSCEINRPEIIAAVRHAFESYNAALEANDVAALNRFFWPSAHTVRFGPKENLFGYAEISEFRSKKWQGSSPRHATQVSITTFGDEFATTNAIFEMPKQDAISRQSQSWVRMPDGWRIVAAHVSFIQTIK